MSKDQYVTVVGTVHICVPDPEEIYLGSEQIWPVPTPPLPPPSGASSENTLSALDFIPESLHAAISDYTSTVDVTSELQTWLDEVSTKKRRGVLPAGLYNTSAPLYVTRVDPSAFLTSWIEGDGNGYTETIGQTILKCSQVDAPALIVDRGRGVRIAGMIITGPNQVQPTWPQTDPAAYVLPGVRDSRYSPLAGIAIDATLGPVPPDGGYPGLTYSGSGGGGSKNVVIENVSIDGFVVGLMVSPGQTVQGEVVQFVNGLIHNCQVAYASGQPQTRSCAVRGNDLQYCHTVFDGRMYGEGIGVPPQMTHNSIVHVHRLLNFFDSRGSLSITDSYVEVFNTLGQFGNGFSSIKYILSLRGCQFKLFPLDAGTKFYPFLLETYAPTKFESCSFAENSGNWRTFNIIGDGRVLFETCAYIGGWPMNDEAPIAAGSTAEFSNCRIGRTFGGAPFDLHRFASELTTETRTVTNFVDSMGQVTFEEPTITEGTYLMGGINTPVGSPFPTQTVVALIVTSVDQGIVTAEKLFPDEDYDNIPDPVEVVTGVKIGV